MDSMSSGYATSSSYATDLAYIHDAGFSEFARQSAPGLIALLHRHRIREGHVLELGCGSGRFSQILLDSGYRVTGVDLSPAMIRLARRHAPAADFHAASLWDFPFPPARAITALGEILNYAFDGGRSRADLRRLYRRIHAALAPGGVFVFDFATPDRLPAHLPARHWFEGSDWAVLVETDGRRSRRELNRYIVSYRQSGRAYRRSEELHRLRLLAISEVSADLEAAGFAVTPLRSFGRYRFFPGMAAILARKKS